MRNKNKSQSSRKSGMTLIEALLYVALLSLLMFGLIQYSLDMHYQNIRLSHDIEEAQQ